MRTSEKATTATVHVATVGMATTMTLTDDEAATNTQAGLRRGSADVKKTLMKTAAPAAVKH